MPGDESRKDDRSSPSLKAKVYSLLEGDPERGGTAARVTGLFLVLLIVANVAATVLESVESISAAFPVFFATFEAFSIGVFTVEYVLRLWTCTENAAFSRVVSGRIRYMATPLAVVDLLAFLPFYVPFLVPLDLRFLRVIRVMRILRLFKLGRHLEALRFMEKAVRRGKDALAIAALVVVILVVFSSCLMYALEHEVQPGAFESIPATMWWAIVTLTTVGYGDIYPVTPAGKIVASFIAVLGIAMFAVMTSILATAFIEEMEARLDRRGRRDLSPGETIALLERLEGLRERGVITGEEFEEQKGRILGPGKRGE
ncbi:MAG: regulatory signaling modulator protein AmpE [Methanolinea sp.]|nr:regulatory signaling modulator protein AmpE [Methanolinea sp.]